MIKRVTKHLRTNEAESELQDILENTDYYQKREEIATMKKERKEKKSSVDPTVYFCRLCDKEIS